MKACFHKGVCKHFNEELSDKDGGCAVVEVCKFYVGMDFNELKKEAGVGLKSKTKRHYKKRAKPDAGDDVDIKSCNITEKQFKKARKKISNAQQNDKLTENQEIAVKSLKGIPFKTATAEQKEQIVSIAKDIK